MGNGSGVDDDLIGGAITLDMLKKAVEQSAANFGKPNQIFINASMINHMGSWENYPEYHGTEWAHYGRMSKREHAFAKLQVFLIKFGLQEHLEDPDARRADSEMASKRLRRSRAYRYQQRKRQNR